MPRNPDNLEAPGIFRRGNQFWLRYSVENQQVRVPLGTTDYADAVRIAGDLRGKKTKKLKTGWKIDFDRYVAAKTAGKKPDFSPKTVVTVKHAIESFRSFFNLSAVSEVVSDMPQRYYDGSQSEYAEATLRGYVAKSTAFLRWCGIPLLEVEYDRELNERDTVVEPEDVKMLIAECPREDIRFFLFCGFMCGMRKDEVVMARPSWFDLRGRTLTIPAEDNGWTPKSGKRRKIPIPPTFGVWLSGTQLLDKDRYFCLHPEASGVRYRWDPRRPFTEYIAASRVERCTPHTMRHTYISLLARQGVPLASISAWSGDLLATLEKHYIHVKVDPDAVGGIFGDIEMLNDDQLSEEAINNKLFPWRQVWRRDTF